MSNTTKRVFEFRRAADARAAAAEAKLAGFTAQADSALSGPYVTATVEPGEEARVHSIMHRHGGVPEKER